MADTRAEILDVRRATLSDLLNGHAALSTEMALRIEKSFAVAMDMPLRMQAWHDSLVILRHNDQKSWDAGLASVVSRK